MREALARTADAIFALMEERARYRAVLALVLASSSPPLVQQRAREALDPDLTREAIDCAKKECGWPS